MKQVLFTATALSMLFAKSAQAQSSWYVNDNQSVNDVFTTATGDDLNAGNSPAAPMLTINAVVAAAAPGDTIWVDAGQYAENVIVGKSLYFRGAGEQHSVMNGPVTLPVGATPALFKVSAQNVTIENFSLNVDFSKLWSAIITSDNAANLHIKDNVIKAFRSSNANAAVYSDRNAISINSIRPIPGVTISAGGFDGAVITNNLIEGTAAGVLDAADWRAGVHVERCGVTVGGDLSADGNVIASINHDVFIRFQNSGSSTVKNNIFLGGGVQFAEPNSSAGDVVIENNSFNYSYPDAPPFAIMRLQNSAAGKNVLVKNNIFDGHNWYISMENFRKVTIDSNTFIPVIKDAVNNNQYRLITVNTKLLASTALSSIQRQAISADIINNHFEAPVSGTASGKALAFYNHWNDGSATYGVFNIGKEGQPNYFNNSITTYLYLDSSNNENTSSLFASFPEYSDANTASSTTGYWTKDIDVSNNIFDIGNGNEPASGLSYNEVTTALEPLVFHKKDNTNVGSAFFRMPVLNVNTGVKYPTIQYAINAASANDSLFAEANGWEYHEDVNVNKAGLKLAGTLNNTDTTKLFGINQPGANANTLIIGSGATVSNMMITREGNNASEWNSNVKNQGVIMNAGAILRHCYIHGNRNGVYINNAKKALVEYCDIDFNRTGIQMANNVDSTVIRNNNITNNWTIGVLYNFNSFPDFTGNVMINNNNITNNWYSQAENRVATVIDMAGNWWGNDTIDVTTTGSGEPGYTVQVPVEYGGTANFADGNHYMIAGVNEAIDYTAALLNGNNQLAAGTPGFEPSIDSLYVDTLAPLAAGKTRLQRAADMVEDGGTLVLADSIMPSVLITDKNIVLKGQNNPEVLQISGIVLDGAGKEITAMSSILVTDTFNLINGIIHSDTVNKLIIDAATADILVTPDAETYVDGPLYVNNVTKDVVLPIGKNGRGNYIKLDYESGNGNMVAEYFPQAQGISSNFDSTSLVAVSDKEYWMLERASGDVSGHVGLYVIDQSFSANGLADASSQSIVVCHYDADSMKWMSLGNDNLSSITDTPLIINAGIVSGHFSPFTLGIPFNTPLPLEILDFKGHEENGAAVLAWTAVDEAGTDYYELEKSTDGRNFQVLTKVQPQHQAISNYSITDNKFQQDSYYRIRKVSRGTGSYHSKIVFLRKGMTAGEARLYPNPVTQNLHVTVPANKAYQVQIFDVAGRLVWSKEAVEDTAIVDVSGFAAGSYHVKIAAKEGDQYALTFVKK